MKYVKNRENAMPLNQQAQIVLDMIAKAEANGAPRTGEIEAHELREIYKSYSLHKHTKNTITSLDKLIIDLNRVKKKGYSINEAETFNYVYGMGAPIIDSQKRAIASIDISGTKGSINVKTIHELSQHVTDTAKRISEKLIDN